MKLGAQRLTCRGQHGRVHARHDVAGLRPKGPQGQVPTQEAAGASTAGPANFKASIVRAGAAFLSLTAAAPPAAAAADTAAAAAAAGGYVPGPVEIGWEVWVGAAAGVIPFLVASYEFGKRILIQRRCPACKGSGLIRREGRSTRYVKCKECGGMLPWLGWSYFFFSAPGNGGPLLQPRGQTSILYKVPPPPQAMQQQQQQQQGREQQQRHQESTLKGDSDGACEN